MVICSFAPSIYIKIRTSKKELNIFRSSEYKNLSTHFCVPTCLKYFIYILKSSKRVPITPKSKNLMRPKHDFLLQTLVNL